MNADGVDGKAVFLDAGRAHSGGAGGAESWEDVLELVDW